jgi:DNA repair exonuclease SbcCD ATPase subunit
MNGPYISYIKLSAFEGSTQTLEFELSPGLTVVTGPNGIGKSTLARIIRVNLGVENAQNADFANLTWKDKGDSFHSECSAGTVKWTDQKKPELAHMSTGSLLELDIRSLLDPHNKSDQSVATQLATDLAGGINMEALQKRFMAPLTTRLPKDLAINLERARTNLQAAEKNSDKAKASQEELDDLKGELEQLKDKKKLLKPYKFAEEFFVLRNVLCGTRCELFALPHDQLRNLKDDDLENFRELSGTLYHANRKLKDADNECTAAFLARTVLPPQSSLLEEATSYEERISELGEASGFLLDAAKENFRAEELTSAIKSIRESLGLNSRPSHLASKPGTIESDDLGAPQQIGMPKWRQRGVLAFAIILAMTAPLAGSEYSPIAGSALALVAVLLLIRYLGASARDQSISKTIRKLDSLDMERKRAERNRENLRGDAEKKLKGMIKLNVNHFRVQQQIFLIKQAYQDIRDSINTRNLENVKRGNTEAKMADILNRVGIALESENQEYQLVQLDGNHSDYKIHTEKIKHLKLKRRDLTEQLKLNNDFQSNACACIQKFNSLDNGLDSLRAEIEKIDESLALETEKSKRLGELESDIRKIKKGSVLSNANAELRKVELNVADKLESVIINRLAKWVLSDLCEPQLQEHLPHQAEVAKSWFQKFTNGQWDLSIRSDGTLSASQLDSASLRSINLDQLSDGTRIQLLLASRLAAIEAEEGGGQPNPICLDEVLSTADPQRFMAVAGAIFKIVDSGRQVIYFAADPMEARQWQHVAENRGFADLSVIDLGCLVETPASWGDKLSAAPTQRPQTPKPLGSSPDEYFIRLDIKAPCGFHEVDSWHIGFVTSPDLDLLYELVEDDVCSVSAWKVRGQDRIDWDRSQLIKARISLLTEFLNQWRIGRSRPVPWSLIVESGGLTNTRRDDIENVWKKHKGDPKLLLNKIKDIKRINQAKADLIGDELCAKGYLPSDSSLQLERLVNVVLKTEKDAAKILGYPAAHDVLKWWFESVAPNSPNSG